MIKVVLALMFSFVYAILAVGGDPWYSNPNLAIGGLFGGMAAFPLMAAIIATPIWGAMRGLSHFSWWNYRPAWKTAFTYTWLVIAIIMASLLTWFKIIDFHPYAR